MKFRLLSVGRPKDDEAARIHDRYAARIRRFSVDYASEFVPETPLGGRYRDTHVREREGRALRAQLERSVPGTANVITLEPGGELVTSEELAGKVETWSRPVAVFVVGGPTGLEPALGGVACWRWSLSPLTFPHELVRPLVAEQLYRALTLRRGVPYHR